MAGDPDLETTKKALLALDEIGADVIELGVPYSVRLAAAVLYTALMARTVASGLHCCAAGPASRRTYNTCLRDKSTGSGNHSTAGITSSMTRTSF